MITDHTILSYSPSLIIYWPKPLVISLNCSYLGADKINVYINNTEVLLVRGFKKISAIHVYFLN